MNVFFRFLTTAALMGKRFNSANFLRKYISLFPQAREEQGGGVFFVTRLKSNAKYRVVKRTRVSKGTGLTCDQTIALL